MPARKFAIKDNWVVKAISGESVLGLRAINPWTREIRNQHFRGADYDNDAERLKVAFEEVALRLNDEGFNIYQPMNPIKLHAVFDAGKSCSGDNIAYRDLGLFDIDRKTTNNQPASDEELNAAEVVADTLIAYFKSEGEEPLAKVMSGNGYHVYYELKDVPNTYESTQIIKQLLQVMAAKFDTDTIKIDTCVYDAPRITKVIGTLARKGVESTDRPFRMVTLC